MFNFKNMPAIKACLRLRNFSLGSESSACEQALDVRGNNGLRELPQGLTAMSKLHLEVPEHLTRKKRQS